MKTDLLFGIHCHQPVDNFDIVVFNAIQKSYKPFFEILKKYPNFKCSVHFSGWLLEFIMNKDKELFELMKQLSSQLEFFSGGFYEPILASISSEDRIAQIKKLNSFIMKHFNQKPKGIWLTERVWDDTIISDLVICGMKYVIVDDYHLISAGITNNLNGYFLTEDNGEQIALFPINKKLRYDIPFANIEELQTTLESFENVSGKNAAIIFDDGEKFGIWPKTYELCYEKNWLESFFELCTKSEVIQTKTYQEFYEQNHAIDLTYLPKVSYAEMGEWSLKPDDIKKYKENEKLLGSTEFLKGGTWKNFFNKYIESNWIHKRVIELSKKQLNTKTYKDNLYRAQCNDVLWHGVFGGIYLPNLRDNAYKYIIACEKELNEQNPKPLDIDFDSYLEYKFNTSNLLSIISPRYGGSIFELDIKDKEFNILNTLSRYKEYYHENLIFEEEEQEELDAKTIHSNKLYIQNDIKVYYDWYTKKSAICHISNKNTSLNEFESCKFKEFGDFTKEEFEVIKKGKNSITLKRDGGIYTDKRHLATLEKTFKFFDEKINTKINLETTSSDQFDHIHEHNMHFMNIKNITINNLTLDDNLELLTDSIIIEDTLLQKQIIFNLKKQTKIFIYKVNTISQSEMGADVTTQGLCFGFVNTFSKKLTFEYDLTIK